MATNYLIEHCKFYYQCPMVWDELKATKDERIHYCEHCHQNVYLCTSQKQYDEAIEKGWCVAVPSAEEPYTDESYTLGMLGPDGDYSSK